MKIKCVFGDNFFDITNKQIELVGQGIAKGKKQLMIVPDRYSLTMERMVLEKLKIKASFDIDVVSFARLASKVLSRVQAPQILSSLGATMVIEMLLTTHEKELSCFKNTAKTIAFASILFDSIAQLKSCKITPQDLYNSIDKLQNSALKLKLNDIALIYKYYEDFLSTQYMDSNNRLKLLGQELENSIEFENYDIHICQFDNITEQGLDLIKILAKQSNSISIGLLVPNKDQNNADCYTKELANFVLPMTKNLNITPDYIEAENSLPSFSKHILHNLMAIKPDFYDLKDKNVKIFSASNPNAEVEFLAKKILSNVKKGQRFRENVANCANLEAYAPIITRVFEKYSIPFWADMPFKLLESEGAKFVFTALDCVQDNFQVKDVLRFAKSSLTGLSIQDYAVFENVVKKYGIVGKRFFDNDLPKFEDPEFQQYLNIKTFLNPLFNLSKNINGSVNIAEMISALRNFFVETCLEDNLNGMALAFEEEGNLLKQSIARQNFDKLNNVLEQMQNILGQVELSFDQFCKIFRSGVSTVTISPLPMSVDCVYVGQSLQSVFTCAPNYFILGATEGSLPAWIADVGLVADSDIAELGDNAIRITPTIRQVNARSKLNVLHSFAMAQKELIVSYAVNNGKDKCEPAGVVNSLQNIFKYDGKDLPIISLSEMLQDDNAFGGQIERVKFLWPSSETMLQDLIKEISNPNSNISPKLLATCWKYLLDNGYEEILNEVLSNLNNEKIISNLSKPMTVFFTQDKARVTQIEKFFQCPYAHFLTYGLKLQQKKTSKPEAIDIGNILHAVFERFGKLIRKQYLDDKQIEKVVPQIFKEVLEQKQFEHLVFAGGNETLLKSLEVEAVHACKAIQYQLKHSQYKIKFIETSFGTSGFASIPEVAILNTDKKIKISGKIDRADLWGKRLRIVDYKTSKSSGTFSLLNFYLGKKIQLFYYMQAILNELGLQAGGAYYLPIHREYSEKSTGLYGSFRLDGVSLYSEANMFAQDDQIDFNHPNSDIVKFGISVDKKKVEKGIISLASNKLGASEEQFANLLVYAKKVLEGAINDIYDGEIRPLFVDNACEYCPYKYVCRKDALDCVKERSDNFNIDLDSFKLGEKDGI